VHVSGEAITVGHDPPGEVDVVLSSSAHNNAKREVLARPLADALQRGTDAALICCGGTAADQRHALLGTRANPGLSHLVTSLVLEACRSAQHEAGSARAHELRLSYYLLQHEAIVDLLRLDQPTEALRLKRSGSRRGVHVSGLTALVVSSVEQALELVEVAELARARLAAPGAHVLIELSLGQKERICGRADLVDGFVRPEATDKAPPPLEVGQAPGARSRRTHTRTSETTTRTSRRTRTGTSRDEGGGESGGGV
jgi:hypothetical protein